MTTMPTSLRLKNLVNRRPMTLQEFRRRYSDRRDGFKYEFENGFVAKTESNMKIRQFHIVDNLSERFRATAAFAKGDRLGIEVEQLTGPEKMRKPDLCLLLKSKVLSEDESVSGFVIEINSPTDRNDDIIRKRLEYFSSGVQVVWQIDPSVETVSVYTSPKTVKICTGDDVCSAAPAVPDFDMTVTEIFQKRT